MGELAPRRNSLTRLRAVLTAAALLLAALIPSATTPTDNRGPVASAADQPVATLVDPKPLDAYVPTAQEVKSQIARNKLDRHPGHYKCRDYPSRDKIVPSDLVPTGNVSFKISYDHHTKQFETIVTDPRVTISHDARYDQQGSSDKFAMTDHYNWTYAPGIELDGIFVRGVDTDNSVEWTVIDEFRRGKDFDLTAWRQELEGRQLDVWVVATDTTTCKPGNTLPSDLWPSVL